MKLAKDEKLVMIGDSITDCGRAQPIAEGLFDPLGRGYVTMVDALLGAVYPQLGIRVVNVGSGGHTVRDLKERWQRDVLDLSPDWVSIMIGTNDVWRQFDLPRQKATHVLLDEYDTTLNELVEKTRPLVKGMVLMTPFFIESNRQDAMRARMDQYGQVVARTAEKYSAIFVNTQAAIDEYLKTYYSGALAWDRVHPNQTGHMIIARAFLKGIGFQW